MLRNLRIKFICLNVATVAIVLLVVFASICGLEHRRSEVSVYNALDEALSMPVGQMGGKANADGAESDWESKSENRMADRAADFDNGQRASMRIGGKQEMHDGYIPVAVFSITESSGFQLIDSSSTASISDEVLSAAYSALENAGDGQGVLDAQGLYYCKRTIGGVAYCAFADTSSASSWKSLALMFAGVGVAALLVFLVISYFFSKWALRPVEEAWSMQRQFVADASHELKTPLTVILANSSILLSHPESSVAAQSQWVESTKAEAERMQGLVGDMLELAKSDAKQGGATEEIDFSTLVEGEVLQFESVAFERGVDFDSAIAEDLTINAERSRIERLVSTLLDNAFKYVDPSGEVEVVLSKSSGNEAVLSVKNTGPAIDPADLPHLFDRFYRADKARTRTGGYGLGLAIAKETVVAAGGSIDAKSDDVSGTMFTVKLPLA